MYDVTMPKLSDSMEEGKIIAWKVKEGDAVAEGDVLAEVESDKATMELECFQSGTVSKIVHGDGDEVPVGEIIAFIAEEGEEAQEKPKAEKKPAEPKEGPRKPAPQAAKKPEPKTEPRRETGGKRVAVSPYAKKLAEEKGVDYRQVKGTGPDGRIIARDVLAAAGEGKAPKARPDAAEKKPKPEPKQVGRAVEPLRRALAEKYGIDLDEVAGAGVGDRITVEDVEAARHEGIEPVTKPTPDEELPRIEISPDEADVEDAPFRLKTQARRVTASKHVIPHFYITQAVDVTALMAKKDEIKSSSGATITHVIMWACLKALAEHPEINRSYDHARVIKWKQINLGLAIDTEEGLTVAVLRDAGALSFADMVERTRDLVEQARGGKLSAEARSHATFTVTNLGMFDVEHFQPIINPPSSVVLAVSSALAAPVVRDDAIGIGRVMRLTAACDHRIVDGATVARFLVDLKKRLQNSDGLLEE